MGTCQRGIQTIAADLHARRQLPQNAGAQGIVEIEDGPLEPRDLEEAALGQAVAGHVAVIVEMIPAQIGEDGMAEVHARRPALVQGMGGNLHGHGPGPALAQPGQGLLETHRVRGPVAGGLQIVGKADPQGADQTTGDLPGQGLGQVVGDAGLAVGAGDAQYLKVGARLAQEAAGQAARLVAQIRHGDDRQAQVGAEAGQGHRVPGIPRLGGDSGRAPRPGLSGEVEPMALTTLTGEKEPAWLDTAAVQGQTGDSHILARRQVRHGKAREQIAQSPQGSRG